MHQTKNVLFLAITFMIIGLSIVFFTHQPSNQTDVFIAQENYIEHIEPWIDSIHLDQSLISISDTKNNLFNFKGADHSMGKAHIALFLAFDSWEKFLLTGNNDNKEQAIKHFYLAADLLPEFSSKIKNLENILKQQNV